MQPTKDIKISNLRIDHVSDIVAYVRWELEEGFEFGVNDKVDIFYKVDGEEYPEEAKPTGRRFIY